MSSGIVLLNKGGAAVAADSAITVGNRSAIFHTQNKLFQIGVSPVVAVFYGNTMFSNVPVEVVFGQFDTYMKKHIFQKPKLIDYFKEFVQFLEENQDFFKFPVQEKRFLSNFVREVTFDALSFVKNHIGKPSIIGELEKFIQMRKNQDKNSIKNSFSWQYVIQKDPDFVTKHYQEYLQLNQKRNFEENPIDNGDKEVIKILDNLCSLSTQNPRYFYSRRMGICFVGYGENDLYPALYHFYYLGFAQGHLIYEELIDYPISDDYPRGILTLAQDDVMQAVIHGVDESIKQTIESHYNQQATSFFEQEKSHAKQANDIENLTNRYYEHIEKKLNIDDEIRFYSNKIFATVQLLSVSDLADFAENLINIQILRRKYETDSEFNGTVGGPTDVVTITKAEGVQWVKHPKR
jgi:hypothetical protein